MTLADSITAELPELRRQAESLMTQTCTRRRATAGAEDDYGNPVEGVAEEVTYKCRKVPAPGSERTSDRVAQIHEAVFSLPYDADVIGSDVLIHDGDTWEVLGPADTRLWAVQRRVTVRHVEGA